MESSTNSVSQGTIANMTARDRNRKQPAVATIGGHNYRAHIRGPDRGIVSAKQNVRNRQNPLSGANR